MKKFGILAATAAMVAVTPALAQAATAYSTANVNLRAGPSTSYPAVVVIPDGSKLQVFGCLQSPNWCDVGFAGGRGWVSGTYIQMSYSSKRVYVKPDYYQRLNVPIVTFSVDSYWDNHYKSRKFYSERSRWEKYDGEHRRDAQPARVDNRHDNNHSQMNAPKPVDNRTPDAHHDMKSPMKSDMQKPDARKPDDKPRMDNKAPDHRDNKAPMKPQADGKAGNQQKQMKLPPCKPGQSGDCQAN